MAQVIIRKNAGSTYIVELAGHERELGKIECLVRLPREPGKSASEPVKRAAILQRANELAIVLHAELDRASQ